VFNIQQETSIWSAHLSHSLTWVRSAGWDWLRCGTRPHCCWESLLVGSSGITVCGTDDSWACRCGSLWRESLLPLLWEWDTSAEGQGCCDEVWSSSVGGLKHRGKSSTSCSGRLASHSYLEVEPLSATGLTDAAVRIPISFATAPHEYLTDWLTWTWAQEFPNNFQNLKVHYSVHMNPHWSYPVPD
jgi:hypothetical protein